jgi:phosphoglycolate phosphatase
MKTSGLSIRCGDRIYPNIQAIVFDKDGTLANSQAFLLKLVEARLEGLRSRFDTVPAAKLRQAWGVTDEGLLNPLGLMAVGSRRENEIVTAGILAAETWVLGLKQVNEAFTEASGMFPSRAHLTPLHPGLTTLVRSLFQRGLKLAVLSADRTDHVIDFIEYHGLAGYFEVILGNQPDMPKPDPRLLALVCNRLGVSPSNTLMIGDSNADIDLALGATAAGAVGVTWCWPRKFVLPGAEVMLDRVEEIEVLPGV